MKVIIIMLVFIKILVAGGFDASEQKNGDFHIYTVDNKEAKINSKIIEDALKSKGFIIGENANIQAELLHIYKDDNFKIYNNISFYHSDLTLKLLNKHADAGIFIPMGIVVYQNLGEDDLHIVLARADMQAKIIGVDPQELEDIENVLLTMIRTLFPSASHSYNKSKSQEEKLLTKYALDIKDADFEDAKEELEESFEEKFAEAGFAMPSYFDLTDALGEDSPYDFYVTYAICKIDVLRVLIKANPHAPVLGPCTTMIYKKKNEQKIVMGFASMYNWIGSANIEDKTSIEALLQTQKIYEDILKDVTKN